MAFPHHFPAGQRLARTARNRPKQQPGWRAQVKASSRECSQARQIVKRRLAASAEAWSEEFGGRVGERVSAEAGWVWTGGGAGELAMSHGRPWGQGKSAEGRWK